MTRMDDELPWFRDLSAEDRSWVGLIVQAGIRGFVEWYDVEVEARPHDPLDVVVFGAATAIFGVSRIYVLSLAMLAILGAADMFSVYIRQSLIQLHTPDVMRGRVSAVSQLTISASNELGEFESGVMAAMLGPVGAVVFGGVGAIAVTIGWARLFPELGRAKTFDPPEILETEPQHGEAKP